MRVIVGLGALTALGFLFASTLRDVASEPYTVRAVDLRRWTVELDERPEPDGPLLLLRPPATLSMGLFDQVFQRTMESSTSPDGPGIPLLLQNEFQRSLAGKVSPNELVALARKVGLETATLDPRCMSVYRTTNGREQRLFFVLFDLPQLTQFRSELAQLIQEQGVGEPFDRDALFPVLLVASSEPGRLQRIPRRADLELACEAPVTPE